MSRVVGLGSASIHEILKIGFIHGAVLCSLMTILILVSLRQDPLIWVRSGPKDLQKVVGPVPAVSLRRRKAWAGVMLVIVIGVFWHLAHQVMVLSGGFQAWAVAGASLVAFQLFNLYDAVVLDLGLVILRPAWAFPNGMADLPGLRDPLWHLGNYAKGFVGGFVFAALVTLVSWGASR